MLFTVAKKFQHTENTAAKLLHMQNMQTQIHMHLFNCLSYNGTNNNHDSKHDEFRCSDTIKQNQVVFGSSKSNWQHSLLRQDIMLFDKQGQNEILQQPCEQAACWQARV